MKVVTNKVDFELSELRKDLPYLSTFYSDQGEFRDDVTELLAFPLANKENMPFYTVAQESCVGIAETCEGGYDAMVAAVGHAFKNRDLLLKFFDGEMLRSPAGKDFLDYAEFTFNQRSPISQALYGRFDLAFDPVEEKITGVYEFNGDTPVMLFESTALQNNLVEQVTGGSQQQFNEYYSMMKDSLKEQSLRGKTFGVVFDGNYVEDSATCEILTQVLGEHTT